MRLIDADEIRIKPEYMHDICGVVMIRVEDIARILNDMPTIKPEQHWIPCTPETMPEYGQEVFTRDTYGCIWICSLIFAGRNNEAYWEDNYGYLYNLDEQIAWMPLPEPYKPEEETE